MKTLNILITGMALFLFSSSLVAQDWSYGIGTGFAGLGYDGDIGFGTAFGPIRSDIDLDADDTRDLIKSGFGFGGYARKENLTIIYALGTMEWDDRASGLGDEGLGQLDINYETVAAKLMFDYTFSRSGNHAWGIRTGVQYTSQEYEIDYVYNGATIGPSAFTFKPDDSWVDWVLGLNYSYSLSNNAVWSTSIEAGWGDTEGSSLIDTGISWLFDNSWSIRLYANVANVDYDSGNPGDADWYLYDVEETKFGFSFMYNW